MEIKASDRRKSIKNAGTEGKRHFEDEIEFDDVTSDAANYGHIQFWDLRYANEHEPFEWYYGYSHFKETIKESVHLDGKVMVAGCGSSNMIGDMAEDGFTSIVGADWSRVVIAQLKYRYKDYPEISFFQGNMLDTDLPESSFNAIIDKALMDSILCTQMSTVSAAQYIYEVERLLDDEGVYVCISSRNPEQLLPIIEQFDLDEPSFTPWIVEVQALCKLLIKINIKINNFFL